MVQYRLLLPEHGVVDLSIHNHGLEHGTLTDDELDHAVNDA